MRNGQSTRPRETQQPRAARAATATPEAPVRKERRAQGRNKTVGTDRSQKKPMLTQA